ncbi:DUF4209 domain-containing protein [Aeromonas sp. 600948]|uniref:DUF4209 domain-containing protein n=1 Tax=Aeromonas sp. 600948 TaxID=2712034 RepID=UPI003B9E7AD1
MTDDNKTSVKMTIANVLKYDSAYLLNQVLPKSSVDEACITYYETAVGITSLRFKNHDLFKPYDSDFIEWNYLDINDEQWSCIEELCYLSRDETIKFICNDILWLNKKNDPTHIENALSSIFEIELSIDELYGKQEGLITRAFCLAEYHKNKDLINRLRDKLYSFIEKNRDNHEISHVLSLVCSNNKMAKYSNEFGYICFDLAIGMARRDSEVTALRKSIHLYDLGEQFFKKNRRMTSYIKMLSALTMEIIGDYVCNRNESSAANIISNIEYSNAIKKIKGLDKQYRHENKYDEVITRLHRKKEVAGKESLHFFPKTKEKASISDDTFTFVRSFAGITKQEALKKLAIELPRLVNNSTRPSLFREEKGFFSSFFNTSLSLDDGGRTVSIDSINDSDEKRALYRASNNSKILLQYIVKVFVIPILQIINLEHNVTLDDFYKICKLSSIVPEEQKCMAAKAIYYGFSFDFQTSIYLLSPILENIIRTILKEQGAVTTKRDTNSDEDCELALGSLLRIPLSSEVFSEDLTLELQLLFTLTSGENLRNRSAHGLITDNAANSHGAIYAWWLLFSWFYLTQPIVDKV